MKWTDEYAGSLAEVSDYLKKLASRIGKNSLSVEGKGIQFPDGEVECSVKYQEDVDECKLTIKLQWPLEGGVDGTEEDEEE